MGLAVNPSPVVNESWFNNFMARPRHITDERLLTAAGRVVSRLGPGFTLADVASEAQVAVGTVAQRFGSKHGLLVAMTRTAIDGMRGQMRGSVPDAGGADAVVRVLVAAYAPLDDSATAANNLAQLAADLADDELRGLMAEFYAVMEAEVAALIRGAAGGLPGAPPAPVAARILTAVADGTAIHWSARPEGGLCDRMRADLTAVMAGWRAPVGWQQEEKRGRGL
ncbi:MAG TPA: TetR family transcriptional regulator C-terminal domain-containing protein [Actinoallomurus sp.]|nr:TetR family transcriptional regulator C-terminal domain-containing protein [Actinoallomurus sp.]